MSFKDSIEDMRFWETRAQKTQVEFEQKRNENDQARRELQMKEAEYRQKRTEVGQIKDRLKKKEDECNQVRSELKQKEVEYHQQRIDLEEKGIQYRHAAEQFQLRTKQLDDFEAFWQRHKNSTQQTDKDHTVGAGNSAASPVSRGSAYIREPILEDMPTPFFVSRESEISETPTSQLVRAGPFVTLKLPSWRLMEAIEKSSMLPSRSGSSKQAVDSKKRSRKKTKSESEDDSEIDNENPDDLWREVSQLGKPVAEPPTKRRRPIAGTYLVPLDPPTILEATERAKLMARFCKPIIALFKSALRLVVTPDSSVKMRREFDTLEPMLQRDALTMEENFWTWIESVKNTIRSSSFRYGTDRDVIVARLQRWNDVYDECMHSCQYELYTNSQRVLAIDSAVNTLKQDFATLSEDIIAIVKSDVLK